MAGDLTPALLEQHLLCFLTEESSEARRALESQLQQALRVPLALACLAEVCVHSETAYVRQLAAVLFRGKAVRLWRKLTPEVKTSIKTGLLARVASEPHVGARAAVMHAVVIIAKAEGDQWPELNQFRESALSSAAPEHREVGLRLLAVTLEGLTDIPDLPAWTQVCALLGQALGDGSDTVRVAALRPTERLLELIIGGAEQEATQHEAAVAAHVVAPLATLAAALVEAGDGALALQAFTRIAEVLSGPPSVVGTHRPALLDLCLRVTMQADVEDQVRVAAMSCLISCAENTPRQLVALQLINQVIGMCASVVVEFAGERESMRAEMTPGHSAVRLLLLLSRNIAPKRVFPAIMAVAPGLCASGSADQRAAGFVLLECVSEGCSDVMQPHLQTLLGLVVNGMQDSESSVRQDACMFLASLCEYLVEDVREAHVQLIPLLSALLTDASSDVVDKALFALHSLLEGADESVHPLVPELMQRFLSMAATPGTKTSVLEMVITAIATCALTLGSDFGPFFQPTMQLLQQVLSTTVPEQLTMRAHGVECVGMVARAMGADVMAPMLPDLMQMSMHGIELGLDVLREYTYTFWCTLAEIFGAGMQPYLSAMLPPLMQTCSSSDGEVWERPEDPDAADAPSGAAAALLSGGGGDGDDDDDDDDDDDEADFVLAGIRDAFVDEKTAAVICIGTLAKHVAGPLLHDDATLAEVLEQLEDLAGYHHPVVRMNAVRALGIMVVHGARQRVLGDAYRPSPGLPAASVVLPPELHESLVTATMLQIFRILRQDPDRDVVSTAFTAVCEMLQALGASALLVASNDATPRVVQCVATAFEGVMTCLSDDLDYDEDGELAAEVAEVIDGAAECVSAMAGAIGPEFAPVFADLWPVMREVLNPDHSAKHRVSVIGAVAESVVGLRHGCQTLAPELFDAAMRLLRESDSEVQRNSLYCAGVLCEHGGSAIHAHAPRLLQQLMPFFSQDVAAVIRDNAAGAVARLLRTCDLAALHAAVPLPTIIQVFATALPIKEDFAEIENASSCILGLLTHASDAALPQLQALLPGIAAAITAPADVCAANVSQGLLAVLQQMLASENHRQSLVQALQTSLPEQERQAVLTALDHASGQQAQSLS